MGVSKEMDKKFSTLKPGMASLIAKRGCGLKDGSAVVLLKML